MFGFGQRWSSRTWIARLCAAAWISSAAWAATFGTVVQTGGEASDLALDTPRGVLYIANFTANRIDVMSLATNQIVQHINVGPHPASISLSPNDRWLLVALYGNNADPTPPANSLTLIDLAHGNAQSNFPIPDPPLAVAFGYTNMALVVTSKNYIEFDPFFGILNPLDTIADVTAGTLPVPPVSFPPDITGSSVTVTGDGHKAYGMVSATSTVTFHYDFGSRTISPGGVVLQSGTLGPRVVSTNHDGTLSMAGWIQVDANDVFVNYINQSDNEFSVGTTLFDTNRQLIYAQLPVTKGEAPTLQVLNEFTFAPVDRLKLPENTTGKSVLSADINTMYALSESGILVLPVGNLMGTPRITSPSQSLLFLANLCDASATSQTITITDPGGGSTPFTISSPSAGVTVSPSSANTPATITVTVDPAAFTSHGTTEVDLSISSNVAVNVIGSQRVLVNRADPDQKGTILNVPGVLTQILGDPSRDRYYVLREDNNTVLLFNASNNTQIGTLLTLNSPATLAITNDGKHLLIGHKQSQTILVYDLDSLALVSYIPTSDGGGQEARSLAVSNGQVLAATVDYQNQGHVESIDLVNGVAMQLPSLGVWANLLDTDSVATPSPDGSKILIATSSGNLFVYDASVDTFTYSRNDFGALSGAYAASANNFLVSSHLLDSGLVLSSELSSTAGSTSGFLFTSNGIVRTLAPDSASPGVIERVDPATGLSSGTTRTIEAPLLSTGVFDKSVFTKTLIAVPNHNYYLSLSTSGLMVLPWNFDAFAASPTITSVVSAADGASPPASGGLVSIFGQDLSRANLAESGFPLPTVLGQTCVLLGTTKIPLLYVSPTQINAQIPYEASGAEQMSVRMQDGVSPIFNFTVLPASPVVFTNGTAGPWTNVPLVYRSSANGLLVTAANPVHWQDTLTIELAGMGLTSPPVADGAAAPDSPPSEVVITPTVTLGGVNLTVLSAALVPGQVGVYTVEVSVPKDTPQGLNVPLTVAQAGVSQTVDVRVVQ